jgi:UDP-glucose 4-epimerase
MSPVRKILVTGGAGYVGSHTVLELIDRGFAVVVLDNLSQGHRAAIPPAAEFVRADLKDLAALQQIFIQNDFSAVFHFAGNSLVGESMRQPSLYLGDNVQNAVNLIRAAGERGVTKFVFSSTSNLFGVTDGTPISEETTIAPASPYGESKFVIERALHWAEKIYGMRSACLRYFNAAGADTAGRLGEDHDPETHLIPIVLDVALGRRTHVQIFGADYPTPDGTCVRDYIHVADLADAHIRALDMLEHRSCRYNLGNGRGYSVLEVVETARAVTGMPIPITFGDRRPGDPAALISDSRLIRAELGWQTRYSELPEIIETAWRWRKSHPTGYADRGRPVHSESTKRVFV